MRSQENDHRDVRLVLLALECQKMSRTGHKLRPALVNPDEFRDAPRAVVIVSNEYPDRHYIPPHHHDRAQLLYAVSGVMSVGTDAGTWVVPPLRAVWIPPRTVHEVRILAPVSMRSVNVASRNARGLPDRCGVIHVTPLMRELILRAADFPLLYDERGTEGRIMALILDEIRTFQALPLHLPIPEHARLAALCQQIREEPGSARTLDEWARWSGNSTRNLARQFLMHTGMSFRAWRQQARLLAALGRLAAGAPVTHVALELGYASPSAFNSTRFNPAATDPTVRLSSGRSAIARRTTHV